MTIIDSIKTGLWMRGYRVTETKGITPYDLLVENKYRVRVIQTETPESMVIANNCDIVAKVTKYGKRLYAHQDEPGSNRFSTFTTNPKKVMAKVER